MGHSPSNDLSRHFPFTGILAVAGIAVKGSAPDIETCPFCNGKTFSVFLVDGTYWFRCSYPKCGFTGDSIEAYMKLRKIQDVYEAIRSAFSEGLTEEPLTTFTDHAVNAYKFDVLDRRAKAQLTWQDMQRGIVEQPGPAITQRLQQEHLWGGWNAHQYKLLGRFLGGGTAAELNAALRTTINVLPREGFSSALAANYQSVPGRTCMIHFRGPEMEKFHFMPGFGEEGGLAMMDTLTADEQTVFAVSDELLALYLHRKYFLDNDTPLKLVAYNPWTKSTWSQVNARRVILWDKAIDWKTFAHARRVQNGYISFKPYRTDLSLFVRKTSVYEIMQDVEKAAMSWKEAFVEWLFTKEVAESLKSEAVHQLNFTSREREDIQALCTAPQKEKLHLYFDNIHITKQIVVNRQTITEKDSGWWLQWPKGVEERISDARIRIEREVNDPAGGTTFLYGHVAFKGQKIPFCNDKNDIVKKTKAWMEQVISSAGLGLPIISDIWDKHLFTVAKCFSTPAVGMCYANYGIQPVTGDIVMPKFKISKHAIVEDDFYTPASKVPGLIVRKPAARGLYSTDRGFPARFAYLACFATLATNWVRIQRKELPIPVVAIGNPGSVAHGAVKAFARNIDMPTYLLDDGKKKPIETLRGLLGKYNYPARVETKVTGLLGAYPARNNDFIYLSADKLEGAVLKAAGGWWVIDAPQPNLDPDVLPPIDDFFMYLADLQKRDYNIVTDIESVDAVAADICNYYRRYLNLRGNGHVEGIAELLKVTYSRADSFIDLLYRLQTCGHLRLERTDMAEALKTPLAHEVIVDDAREQVFMSRSRLDRLLKHLRLPALDLLDIQDEMFQRGSKPEDERFSDGVVIPLEYWNKRAAHWKTVNL